MEKNKDIRIFLLCYKKKEYKFLDDKVVTPLQLGAAKSSVDICRTKDNVGNNISDKNLFFVENTGTYWIWKNIKHCKYKGQMQYRRLLHGINETFDFDKAFEDHDVITMIPLYYPDISAPKEEGGCFIPAQTVEGGYEFSNSGGDIHRLEFIIKNYFTDYAEAYDKFIKNGATLFYSNGFIMRSEDYDRYCEFLFGVLNKFREVFHIETDEDVWFHVGRDLGAMAFDNRVYPTESIMFIPRVNMRYQTSIGGFLSERIFTMWVLQNFSDDRILKLPYDKQESGMWI